MNGVVVGTHGDVEARHEVNGAASVSTTEVETLMGLLIDSGRAAAPTRDPARAERVWRRVLEALAESPPAPRPA